MSYGLRTTDHARRRQQVRQARRVLLWGLLFFLGLHLVAAVSVERCMPEARDPEFAIKAERLQVLRRQAPDNPLVLMLGSSRTAEGFRAGDVHARWDGRPALVFNFGLSGGGPVLQLLCLRRLLAGGVRPDLLLIEVLPPTLNQPGKHPLEEVWLQGGRMRLSELRRLGRYHTDPMRLMRRWCRARLIPWPSLHRCAQALLTPEPLDLPAVPGRGKIEKDGWEPQFQNGVTPEQCHHYLQVAREQYRDSMGAFHPAQQPLAAVSALLDLCRREEIPVVLVLMPEGSAFQAFYPAPLRESLDALLANLSTKWQVALIDARDWVADEDLWDAHHPLPSGASVFTKRLADDVICPLLQTLPRLHQASDAQSSLRTSLSVPPSGTSTRSLVLPVSR